MQHALEVAQSAALQAGQAIMEIYETDFSVGYKDDQSPLTIADRASNRIIVEHLREHFPHYALLSEELVDDKCRLQNDWCWIIDPLDGTKEYVRRNGEFTINIALAHKHRVVLGVIYVPVAQELYYAVSGFGAFLETGEVSTRLRVSDRHNNLRLVASRSHGSGELEKLMTDPRVAEVKRAGSSLKGCLVARGDAEAYYRFGPTMEWDTAAMQCIVEEAGGVFCQLDGSEMLYNREDSRNSKGFCALNREDNHLL